MKYLLLKFGSSLQTKILVIFKSGKQEETRSLQTKILVIFKSGKQEETRLQICSSWKTCYWVLA
jgi:hypothetical protein